MSKIFIVCSVFIISIGGFFGVQKLAPEDQIMIEGWKIRISGEYLVLPSRKAAAIDVLTLQLQNIKSVLPAHVVRKLQNVEIWMDHIVPKNAAGFYHYSREWLEQNGKDVDRHQSVAMNYNMVRWRNYQKWIVLHELAHAYHDQVIGIDNKRIFQAYKKAKASRVYDNAKHKRTEAHRAYAMTNHLEYFAELTVSYFGENEQEPFNAAQLKKMDPTGYRLIRDMWNAKIR